MSISGGVDPWRVSADERAKHDNQFFQLKPVAGFITGNQARTFFMQSGLPVQVLGQIWALADMNGDGKMDKKEFSIAMLLIKRKLEGHEIPKALPVSLKADPNPVVGTFGMPPSQPPQQPQQQPQSQPGPALVMGVAPLPSMTSSAGMLQYNSGFNTMPGMTNGSAAGMSFRSPQSGFASLPSQPSGSSSFPATTTAANDVSTGSDWSISQANKLKFTQMFNMHDIAKKGFLTGLEARSILMQTGLVHTVLAQVWNLADVDRDGNLTSEEFCLALHLVEMNRKGKPLPAKLPPELVPPSYRIGTVPAGAAVGVPPGGLPGVPSSPSPITTGMGVGQKDSFGDLLGGIGPPMPQQPAEPVTPSKQVENKAPPMPVTFEDKRRENFNKGQAELEKRQAMLRDQRRKEEESRLAAERAEHEKREKIRLEQEQKRQHELERQMERQRQIELEREDARKKLMEQRESARRELERQRQLEWERQRRDKLMAEKSYELKQVDELAGGVAKLKLELEALDNKKKELHAKIDQARNGVTDFTTSIDMMRQSRDIKNTEIDTFQRELQDWNGKLGILQKERQQLDVQLQAQNNAIDDTVKMAQNSYTTKQQNIEKLKAELGKIEKETSARLKDIDENNSRLIDLKNEVDQFQSTNQKLQASLSQKKSEWEGIKNPEVTKTAKSSVSSAASDWFTNDTSAGGPAKNVDWGSAFSKTEPSTTGSSSAWTAAFSQNITDSEALPQRQLSAESPSASTRPKSLSPKQQSITEGGSLELSNHAVLDRSTSSEKELTGLWEQASGPPASYTDSTKVPESSGWASFQESTDLFGNSQQSTSSQKTTGVKWGDSGLFSKKESEISESRPGYKKYRALYPFDARNFDEVSFQPEDIIWVPLDQSGTDVDWLKGEVAGKTGVFPDSYAECIADAPPESIDTSATVTPTEDNAYTSQTIKSPDSIGSIGRDTPVVDSPSSPPTNVDSQPPGVVTASESSSFTAVEAHPQSPTPGQGEAAPEGLQAQAQYPWKAKKDNHLTFNKGDIINVKEQQDMWWSGELNGNIGWFPKTYVKLIGSSASFAREDTPPISQSRQGDSVESPQSSVQVSAVPLSTYENTPSTNAEVSPASHSQTNGDADVYVAIYNYQEGQPGDLIFNQGDIITVTSKDADWWTGTLGDQTGIFPANYVKKMDIQEQPVVAQSPPASADLTDSDSVTSGSLGRKVGPKAVKKPDIASVIAAYQATGAEQLSLQPGQLIQVRKRSNSGWWEGELQARGQKRRIGWFPANYVKLLGGSARNTPDVGSPMKSLSPTPQGSNADSRSTTPISQPQPTTAPALEQVVSLYNYTSQHEDELSLIKGSIINVSNKDDPDWWKGELNGVTGVFPSNYVTPLTDAIAEDEESSAWGSTKHKEGHSPEQQRQYAIQELISTEEAYMADTRIVLEAFQKPLLADKALTPEESRSIFVNWKELIMCNTKLVKAIRVRRKMTNAQQIPNIGDILCENLPHMTPYIRFCSRQLNAAALIQHKTENDAKFKESHKTCTQNPKTKGMPISSFLLKPMQRITKYPLLIEQILKHTSADHPDRQNLEEALSKAQEICQQVNEGVMARENSDRLEWIQNRVQTEGLNEKLTFNSVTNSLGPRKFLHSGSLYKAKSGKELVGFLFSDFLLLTLPNKPLGSVTSVFSFDTKADTKFKIYRNPIFLNEIMIKKKTEDDTDPCLFNISHIEHIFSLKAVSPTERDSWVRKLEEASNFYLETEKKKREKAHTARLMTSRGCGRLLLVVLEGCNLTASDQSARRNPTVGRLLIVIVEGNNLTPGEDGKSDPYCEVSMGIQEHRTKVINNTLNPKWNASMQFTIKDLQQDVVCITVYDRDLFTPNDFLGRTEIKISDILKDTRAKRGPITRKMVLHEVEAGEVVVRLDLQLYQDN